MQHTPGPWSKRTTIVCGKEWAHMIEQCGHMPHATVFDRSGHGDDTPESEANARLIAAAPDLLSVAARILRSLEWSATEDRMTNEEQAALLRAAIAKATCT
jgi:hypothetical protein